MLKLLDLFSGIGGFSLGLESTGGFETIAFVEKNEKVTTQTRTKQNTKQQQQQKHSVF